MKRWLHPVGSVISVCLFGVAVFVIHDKLKDYRYHDIAAQIRNVHGSMVVLAVALTVLNYLAMTLYDVLALRYIRHRLVYWRVALASFIGYVFSNNATIVGGSAARYRVYSSLGLSAAEVARLVLFCALTFWLGFCTVAGIAFVVSNDHVPRTLGIPFVSVRPLGLLLLLAIGFYLVVVAARKTPLRIRTWEFSLPSLKLSAGQIVVAAADWLLAAAVFYVLLPREGSITFGQVLSVFLLAQLAGLLSYVPGGLGVFETVMLVLLGPSIATSSLIGSLLLYRLIYYVLPLFGASLLLAAHELTAEKGWFKRFSRMFGRWGPAVLPQFFAFVTFAAGTFLLFSGALPAVRGRLTMLRDLLPLPAIELSHFLGSLTGTGLLLLAHGLQRRLQTAYHLTLVLLGAGILFSLLKGLDYEEATILTVMLLALLPCRRQFYRKTSLLARPLAAGWMTLVAVTLLCTVWLGFFAYKHVEYSNELWWRFTATGDAPRFLRATAGTMVLTLVYAVTRLMAPVRPRGATLERTDAEIVETIVKEYPKTYAYLALLGDKEFLFSADRQTFIMYAIEGQSWVAMGDPVGPELSWRDLIWQFSELADQYEGRPVFYQVDAETLHHYTELGMTFMKLGEEAVVDLSSFSLQGSSRSGLRYSHNKVEREHCVFAMLSIEQVAEHLDVLKGISDAWLAAKSTSEKRFSLGAFDPAYLKRCPMAIVRRDDQIVAFANIWTGGGCHELSIDLMRYRPDSPDGIMDYLFTELLLWGRQQGFQTFNFGMAPLSGLESRSPAPLWSKAGALVFRHGEHFYNFQGLRRYKEKFDPIWHPKYVVCQGGLALPGILGNVATLISGSVKGIITK